MTLLGCWSGPETRPTGKANGIGPRSHQPCRRADQPEQRRRIEVRSVTSRPETHARKQPLACPPDGLPRGNTLPLHGEPVSQAAEHRVDSASRRIGDHHVGDPANRTGKRDRARERRNHAIARCGCELEATVARTSRTHGLAEPIDDTSVDGNNGRNGQAHRRHQRGDHAVGPSVVGRSEA